MERTQCPLVGGMLGRGMLGLGLQKADRSPKKKRTIKTLLKKEQVISWLITYSFLRRVLIVLFFLGELSSFCSPNSDHETHSLDATWCDAVCVYFQFENVWCLRCSSIPLLVTKFPLEFGKSIRAFLTFPSLYNYF